jgi:chromosome segregation ATPase
VFLGLTKMTAAYSACAVQNLKRELNATVSNLTAQLKSVNTTLKQQQQLIDQQNSRIFALETKMTKLMQQVNVINAEEQCRPLFTPEILTGRAHETAATQFVGKS